jgi:tetratricopeptide (TPR) repeat protein
MNSPRPLDDFRPHLLRARDWQDRPEFAHLCEWWQRSLGGVYALVGIGGAGKTAIVDRFLQVLPGGYPAPLAASQGPPLRTDLPAIDQPFVFSFYDYPNEDSFFAALAQWLSTVAADPVAEVVRLPTAAEDAHSPPKLSFNQLLLWLRNYTHRRPRTLLVLDGLEKVQDDGHRSGRHGHIPDGRLRSLLLDTADGHLGRLSIVVTTRFDLYDPAAERVPYYWREFVERLDVAACVALLRSRGVREPDDSVLRKLAEEHGRHALTVDLIGGYIGEFCGGRVNRLPPLAELDLSDLDAEFQPRVAALRKQERRFARVAERYREALREHEPATLALLERVCLFRLGTDADTLARIFTGSDESTIKVAGPALAALTRPQLQKALERLVAMKLVEVADRRLSLRESTSFRGAKGDKIFTIHPAVRDGFLAGIATDSRIAGHEALRKGLEVSLGDSPGENPSDAATLDLLEEIVFHTLQSGHVQEAWDFYQSRIGGYRNLGWRLGAYERGERICRAFAGGASPTVALTRVEGRDAAPTPPHSEPVGDSRKLDPPYKSLPEGTQVIFINVWALYLSELGRLEAAARCYELANEPDYRAKNWKGASIGNLNLCDAWLLAGRLTAGQRSRVAPRFEAAPSDSSSRSVPYTELRSNSATQPTIAVLTAAEEALRLAELTDNAVGRQHSYTYRAHARALLGEIPAALVDFHAALDWQHKVEGDDQRPLYSLGGVWHTHLLARLGRRGESQRLIETNQTICQQLFGITDIVTPRYRLILAGLQLESGDVAAAERLCHAAHEWALARDAKEVLCWSALVQARIELAKANQIRTEANEGNEATKNPLFVSFVGFCSNHLESGLKIARACGFGLYHIDLQLELARLRLLQGDPSSALAALAEALDNSRAANPQTNDPALLAATDPCCGYAWAIAEGLQLRAEALLLQAAQTLGSATLDRKRTAPGRPASSRSKKKTAEGGHPTIDPLVRDLITRAEAALQESLTRWQDLRDPARKNANFRDPKTRQQYNYRAAETYSLLTDLQGGILTLNPLKPPESPPPEPKPESNTTSKRFRVALSFPGEHRAFVLQIAEALSASLTRERVFYDEWFEVDLLGAGGDLKLQAMYEQADLVVPFFSQHYGKPWCSLEWETIRGILLKRRADDAVIPVHLDDTDIPGWSAVNFGIRLRGRTAPQIADLILQTLAKRNC